VSELREGVGGDEIMKGINRPCERCKVKKAVHEHHLLSQTASYRGRYEDLIDDERNKMNLCQDCHLSKSLKKLDELQFCRMLKIKPRSKTLLSKIMQGAIDPFWD
jgi:methylphosphotriester-DNA--protein-cysteine methyltransferase